MTEPPEQRDRPADLSLKFRDPLRAALPRLCRHLPFLILVAEPRWLRHSEMTVDGSWLAKIGCIPEENFQQRKAARWTLPYPLFTSMVSIVNRGAVEPANLGEAVSGMLAASEATS